MRFPSLMSPDPHKVGGIFFIDRLGGIVMISNMNEESCSCIVFWIYLWGIPTVYLLFLAHNAIGIRYNLQHRTLHRNLRPWYGKMFDEMCPDDADDFEEIGQILGAGLAIAALWPLVLAIAGVIGLAKGLQLLLKWVSETKIEVK